MKEAAKDGRDCNTRAAKNGRDGNTQGTGRAMEGRDGDIRRGDRGRPPLIGELEGELLGCGCLRGIGF